MIQVGEEVVAEGLQQEEEEEERRELVGVGGLMVDIDRRRRIQGE